MVRCSQTGKTKTVKVGKLSKENLEPLTEEDLAHGSKLLMEYGGKSYDVEVQSQSGMLVTTDISCQHACMHKFGGSLRY